MRTLLFAALFSFLGPCWASTPAPTADPAPAFYAVELKILTPKGNAWGDYDALFHEGVAQAYGAPARISYSGDGQCPNDHLLCPCRVARYSAPTAQKLLIPDLPGRARYTHRPGKKDANA